MDHGNNSNTNMDISLGGKNIAELRDSTGVKVGISKVVQGVPDRVLTAVGTVESVAKVSNYVMAMMDVELTLYFVFCKGIWICCSNLD